MTRGIIEQLREHMQQNGIELTELSDGTSVMLDLAGHQVLSLNKTGTVLSQKLAAPGTSKQDLVRALTGSFAVDRGSAESDVDEFLDALTAILGQQL